MAPPIEPSSWIELVIGVVGAVVGWLSRHFGIGAPKS